jgi:hypothetical protein
VQIISHRGKWTVSKEKNSEEALESSLVSGFGLETDIRDFKGELVISHDIPREGCLPFKRLLEIHRDVAPTLPLALNIKADGLQDAMKTLLSYFGSSFYFVFDMSIPDMRVYLESNLTVFSRHSEYEKKPVLYDQVTGIWLDSFENEWWGEETLRLHLRMKKSVCIVSPELHGRDFKLTWDELASMKIIEDPNLMLCTDYPEQARKFFYEKN